MLFTTTLLLDNKTAEKSADSCEYVGETAILNIIIYTMLISKMASWVRSTDDFSVEDAQIFFKLAKQTKEIYGNPKRSVDENRPTVPKVRLRLVTLTYTLKYNGIE